jgi:hypothetical protein
LLIELGRLGLGIYDIEDHSRPPNSKTVLSDLTEWLSDHPGEAFAKLVNWQALDFSQIQLRLKQNPSARPRIEVAAYITKMNNLSVRWHPGGWRKADIDWHRCDHNHFNLITHRKWMEAPDFHWFSGDEQPTLTSRPSNELMYIRGVGNLRPEPRDNYGAYAAFNADVVDSVLICAVRAAYERLIKQLECNFDVDVVTAFDFEIRDEIDEATPYSHKIPIRRVIAWSLEDTAELKIRREQRAAAERERRDRAELGRVTVTHGFTLEAFIEALQCASLRKATGPAPSSEHLNPKVAKALRSAGFNVNAADVRRIRQLIERYNPNILPMALRPDPPSSHANVAENTTSSL